MRILKFISLILFVLFAKFGSVEAFPNTGESFNGDCAIAPVKDEYKRAKSVFVGRVIKITETADSKIFEFRVQKYWKGVKGKKIKVIVGNTLRFEPFYQSGKSYLIYAFADKGLLRTYKCSRGFQIEFAQADLNLLGKAKIAK